MIFSSVISVSLVITPFISLFLLLVPILDRKYAAKGRYWLWLLIICSLLCVPLFSFVHRPSINIYIPVLTTSTADMDLGKLLGAQNGDPVDTLQNLNIPPTARNVQSVENSTDIEPVPEYSLSIPALNLTNILTIIWLTGILLSLTYHVAVYSSFWRFIRRWSTTVTDTRIIEAFERECMYIGICKNIKLRLCKNINSPLLAGYFKPMVFLPCSLLDMDAIPLIFRHELTHYKRKDIWCKLALIILKSVYWFNPVVHLMAAQVNKDIEAVCDSLTISGMDISLRKRYSEIILSMAAVGSIYQTQLTTCFIGSKSILKKRLSNILSSSKKNALPLFIIIGVLVVSSGFLISCNLSGEAKEPVDAVKNISVDLRKDIEKDVHQEEVIFPTYPYENPFPDLGMRFTLTPKQQTLYDAYIKDFNFNISIFEGVPPIDVAHVFIECGINGLWEGEYNLFYFETKHITKASYKAEFDDDMSKRDIRTRRDMSNLMHSRIKEGTFVDEGNGSGYIEYLTLISPDYIGLYEVMAKMNFHEEDGVWKININRIFEELIQN